MPLLPRPPCPAAITTAAMVFTLSLLITVRAHNITQILAKHPEFSTFNSYLTKTHLADEINSRQTITVCVVDNAAFSTIQNLQISYIKNLLSLHILLDYFDSQKLHQITNGTALAATMFQASGTAAGASGFVNITDLKGGKVGFTTESNSTIASTFVKSVEEIPYNISVIHISNLLPSTTTSDAPAPSPTATNLTSLMSAHGCKIFADTLSSIPEALSTFQDDVDGGLTIFCPNDAVFKSFVPKFKNLTAEAKVSLLLFHGLPVYNSRQMLRSNNGLMNTLATDGARKFDLTVQNDGNEVTIDTKRSVARIESTLVDDQPLAIFVVDKVLLPRELFNSTDAPTPAPEPANEAESPKPHKKGDADADSDSGSPTNAPSDSADQVADANGVVSVGVVRFVTGLGLGVWLCLVVM